MRIININHNPTIEYVYLGRRMGGSQSREASPLGNPFKLTGRKPADVARCLAEYRAWLWDKIRNRDKQVMALFDFITENSVLGCYCVNLEGEAIFTEPERCHAQVVAKCWRWLQSIRKETYQRHPIAG